MINICNPNANYYQFLFRNALSIPIFSRIHIRLAKCHHPHHPGWCKIFRAYVKMGTEHTVYWQKFKVLSQFYTFWGVKFWEMQGILLLECFYKVLVYFNDWKSILLYFFDFKANPLLCAACKPDARRRVARVVGTQCTSAHTHCKPTISRKALYHTQSI